MLVVFARAPFTLSLRPGIEPNPRQMDRHRVRLAPHNREMRSFLVFRERLVEEESASIRAFPAGRREVDAERVPQTHQTSSNLGALLVILAPFAVAAWAGIGLSVYLLLT